MTSLVVTYYTRHLSKSSDNIITKMANKGRKPNWSASELAVLVEACTENYNVVTGKFTSSISARGKDAFWSDTLEK